MENTYGIGVANRYELFYKDEDGSDPIETLMQVKKGTTTANQLNANKTAQTKGKQNLDGKNLNSTGPADQKNLKKSDEKENKSSALNKNQDQNQLNKNKNSSTSKTPSTKSIRENLSDKKDSKSNNKERNSAFSSNIKSEDNREQRNNRRNRDDGNFRNQNFIQSSELSNREDRPPRRNNNNQGNGGGVDRGQASVGNRRNFDGRGKREFDRQSGSDKTGVKAVDKRDGAGAHNWGNAKQDIEDLNNTSVVVDKDESLEHKEENNGESVAVAVEEEAKELTLDEWKAQRAVRAKPQYNLRKAGEGEDLSQWKKMVKIENKKKNDGPSEDDDVEFDASLYPQRAGRQKHLLDIEFHFNDGRRGGLGRGRGGRSRGGPMGGGNSGSGGGGMGRGGPGNRRERPDRGERDQAGVDGAEPRPERPEREHRERPEREHRERRGGGGNGINREGGGERLERGDRNRFEDRRGNQHAAPKVDDERDFPSLG